MEFHIARGRGFYGQDLTLVLGSVIARNSHKPRILTLQSSGRSVDLHVWFLTLVLAAFGYCDIGIDVWSST